ncbi:winged helix DNA-binding domain-containing protein [Brevibacterium spongiae]|uniref:Winged helix DNA-binding domain-containing protein n=1 Tax=Brevibacterium spongiae TaxID=2909672 RepID=A0ABY5SSN3_9MICO|nr:winged helix DNA-binding domain-containing protein [Brevibacterium spongiae]UVI37557.1 winged helix DNA-binding domain-containing protein [Brevibacterium spongiae]
MDAHQISAARLLSQGLVGPPPESPTGSSLSPAGAVVEHLGCVQAQALGGALTSVALRLGADATDGVAAVRAAIDAGEIVRSWTQRGTIHLTTAKDIGWVLSLTGARTMRSTAKRREFFGITDPMLDAAAELAVAALREHGALTREELLEAFAPLGAGDEYGHARYLITSLALQNLIVQAPMIEGKDDMKYVLTADWVPTPTELDAEAALREWMRRFVLSHGPVTIDDATRWTGLPKTQVRNAVRSCVDAGEIVSVRIGEIDHVQAPDLEDRLSEWESAAHETMLLPGFDEIILGYKDRTATLDAEHEKLVVPGGNGMFKNTVVTGTRAQGTWKRSPRKTGPRVIVVAFPGHTVDTAAVESVAADHPAFA